MKLIAQILPYVRKALRQNQHDQEAKELIRQIEQNAFTTSGATTADAYSHLSISESASSQQNINALTNKIHKLEEELGELKETHQRELMCMQQEMNQ